MKRDTAIDALLDLHGSIIDQGSGYWVKLEAWKEDVSDKGVHYEFKDAQTLIDDFFRDVDRVLLEVKKK